MGREQTVSYQDKRIMTGGVMTAISCNPFSDDRTFLLCFKVVSLVIVTKLRLEILPGDDLLWLASFL